MARIAAALLLAAVLACPARAETIPLEPGLVVVGASVLPYGDFETVTTVSAADASGITLSVDAVRMGDPPAADDPSPFKTWTGAHFDRTIRRADLESATRMNQVYMTGDPGSFPGSTTDIASAAVLNNLKTKGETPFILGTVAGGEAAFGPILGSGRRFFRGTLRRVDPAGAVTVLVNGRPVEIAAIHASGELTLASETIVFDAWIADDPANAMILKVAGGRYQIVRIDYPVEPVAEPAPGAPPAETPAAPPAQAALDAALSAEGCAAELHGLYFDSGKADLLPPSRRTLADAAAVIAGHDDWTVTIAGHTDSAGEEAYNLDLSRRRAQAVRAALIADFGVAEARIASEGFGETRPVADNATVEGRARNRRVEISRACSEGLP